MTLSMVRVKLGKSDKTIGITYVALSRVRHLRDLLIDYSDFGAARLTSITLPQYARQADCDTKELIEKTKKDFNFLGG